MDYLQTSVGKQEVVLSQIMVIINIKKLKKCQIRVADYFLKNKLKFINNKFIK
jgi:hypothetical protein